MLGVSPSAVQQWMSSFSIPIGHLRKVSELSKIPLEQFFEYEESQVKG
jgi:hypothetical protein